MNLLYDIIAYIAISEVSRKDVEIKIKLANVFKICFLLINLTISSSHMNADAKKKANRDTKKIPKSDNMMFLDGPLQPER